MWFTCFNNNNNNEQLFVILNMICTLLRNTVENISSFYNVVENIYDFFLLYSNDTLMEKFFRGAKRNYNIGKYSQQWISNQCNSLVVTICIDLKKKLRTFFIRNRNHNIFPLELHRKLLRILILFFCWERDRSAQYLTYSSNIFKLRSARVGASRNITTKFIGIRETWRTQSLALNNYLSFLILWSGFFRRSLWKKSIKLIAMFELESIHKPILLSTLQYIFLLLFKRSFNIFFVKKCISSWTNSEIIMSGSEGKK